MRFISPKTDFAFKKIFGSTESKDILISFLNAIIYEGRDVIQDLEIIDPYTGGSTLELKDSYLDVKAVLDNNSTVIIEMQVLNVAAFEKRVVYNLAKIYGNQLSRGESYFQLTPVIALTITDFTMFKQSSKIINRFVFKEKQKLFDYPDQELEMVFVELPKFSKNLEELDTITDKWIYFIKEVPSLEIIPSNLEEVAEINKALNIANQANLSKKELENLEKQEMFVLDQQGSLIKAKQEREIKWISRLLQKSFGEIPEAILNQIEKLSLENLEMLGELILDWENLDDLSVWLKQRRK
ncbi:MAG: Rpn family recombination-promoting nuclease/putative transposase [Microcoleaceae cyanobacterium MO_207.B10]|nr:Rpn family recombination-promoting nuclease/putative transposase [Microcoleaceae cyanobacterium MO_207.B10]